MFLKLFRLNTKKKLEDRKGIGKTAISTPEGLHIKTKELSKHVFVSFLASIVLKLQFKEHKVK